MLPDSKAWKIWWTIARTCAVTAPSLNARRGIGVDPFEIEPHVQRPIVDVGQRGVLVAHEAVEGAAAEAQQAEAAHAGARFHRRPRAVSLDARAGALGAGGREGRAASSAPRYGISVRRHLNAFHLRVRLQELAARKRQ